MRPILVRRHLIDAVHWHDAVRTATADFTESGLGREKFATDQGNRSIARQQ